MSISVDVHLSGDEWESAMVEDCRAGLSASPKHLSPMWFYDERGSELFDQITRLPEYYPTRAERSILDDHAVEIVDMAASDTLVELGSGTSDKTRWLLDAMAATGRLERYVPFDVSEATVRIAAEELAQDHPGLEIHAVIGDFHRHLGTIPRSGRRLVAFLGGTIGNLVPAERRRFLADLVATMGPDDRFLLGADLVKDRDVLVNAYDDSAGVTAAFNRNALLHLNERLGADFEPSAFEHVARWNEEKSWIEMRLRSQREQTVRIDALGMTVEFAAGEELRTEISAKFTEDQIARELEDAGFEIHHRWCAEPGFLLTLAGPHAPAAGSV